MLTIFANYGSERAGCDVTFYTKVMFINTTSLHLTFFEVSETAQKQIPFNEGTKDIVMAAEIE